MPWGGRSLHPGPAQAAWAGPAWHRTGASSKVCAHSASQQYFSIAFSVCLNPGGTGGSASATSCVSSKFFVSEFSSTFSYPSAVVIIQCDKMSLAHAPPNRRCHFETMIARSAARGPAADSSSGRLAIVAFERGMKSAVRNLLSNLSLLRSARLPRARTHMMSPKI